MDTKICKNCGKNKILHLFHLSKQNSDGHEGICKNCRNNQTYAAKLRRKASDPEAYKQYHNKINKRFYSKPGVRRNENLRHLYGIEQDWYDRKLIEQHGVCAICGGGAKENRFFHIDHDHSHHENSKKGCEYCLRGLLCEKCNRGLGSFNEDIGSLYNAIKYLNQYKSS